MKFLDELNDVQKEAATHIDGALLILAGAGSGKTKTITTRLAYLLSLGIDPANTLTLTFTNKAANEMRERALSLLEGQNIPHPPLLSTFHKFGLMFLKLYIHLINRDNNFVIIDSDDQRKIIKQISSDLPPNFISKEISKYKNSFLTPDEVYALATDSVYKNLAHIYEKYQNYLLENNLVDFDDLLLLTYKILNENDDLADEISDKYQYIMVDEYQDTNEIQLLLLKRLCKNHNNICVVGDDDQSIYGFRGANHKNILDFEKDFNAKVIKLEINYRSTNQILNAANNLISFNKNRYGKKLISARGDGKDIEILRNYNEIAEAEMIAKKIRDLINQGVDPKEIAVLYRINALSRSIEDGLRNYGIPYKLVGGMKFYEREEIKDLISYLRLLVNPHDDYSFKRVVNKPRRGIGKATIAKIEEAKGDKSFIEYIKENDLSIISKKAAKTLKDFVNTLELLSKMSLDELPENLEEIFELSKSYKDEDKARNIEEFYGMMRERSDLNIREFLNELSLETDQDKITMDMINVMTIHASKGLEFDHLFVIGMEEGFFPLNDADIEEERRLAYVAITRARKDLTLSYVESRYIHGKRSPVNKSRFLTEAGLIKGERVELKESSAIKTGSLVKHKVFGTGRVLGINKAGNKTKLKIDFGGSVREILSDFVEKV
ncbi:ATP-dependent helicase [Caminibacter pacificus]|uniref:DNA 3'-5' helicase n=1 Tax=Caminibacter pacificus TaxID=1424653 RepID=A0AAJ4RCZ5_9BACT|nr:UvrD-helicase domain-containing protein [Caminibacter pacificus]QDD68095.1 ATP-dependent helicase [Caminibacter pacificus]ROR39998.1 DNA helicase-2/ATP-dependent DNA helicase PcrA [Caminibacter pacificus]